MSIIVAVKKNDTVAIAADSQLNFGGYTAGPHNVTNQKVIKIGGAHIGSVGWAIYDNILDAYFSKNEVELTDKMSVFSFFLAFQKHVFGEYRYNDASERDSVNPFSSLDSQFIVATKSDIFVVSQDISVSQFDRYCAIGSGDSYALGALCAIYESDICAVDLARRSVSVAIGFDTRCGGEIMSSVVG